VADPSGDDEHSPTRAGWRVAHEAERDEDEDEEEEEEEEEEDQLVSAPGIPVCAVDQIRSDSKGMRRNGGVWFAETASPTNWLAIGTVRSCPSASIPR
jgi:hypothetical protein